MHEHVPVVEDDRLIARAMDMRLRASGYRVSLAADVDAAARAALDDTPDVTLMDINLPDGDGISLASRMRALRTTVGVPIIFVTASRDPAHRERARALGIRLLEKPFPAAALLEAIAESVGAEIPTSASRRAWTG